MIEVKNLIKSFDGRTVLHDVSARFETGRTNLIIGQSGSGKTVLMKSLVGLITPDSGKILFDGRDLLTMSSDERKELRKEIGMLFQGSALFDSETVLGNVSFPLVMFSKMSPAESMEMLSSTPPRLRKSLSDRLSPESSWCRPTITATASPTTPGMCLPVRILIRPYLLP